MLLSLLELIGKKIGQGDNPRVGIRHKTRADCRATPATPEDAEPHGGVGGGPAHQVWLDDHESRGCRRCTQELSATQLILVIIHHCVFSSLDRWRQIVISRLLRVDVPAAMSSYE
jgi:hypothetical protein